MRAIWLSGNSLLTFPFTLFYLFFAIFIIASSLVKTMFKKLCCFCFTSTGSFLGNPTIAAKTR